MNKLSWLLYWADTLPSLARGVGTVFWVLSVLCLVCFVAHLVLATASDYASEDYRESGRPLKFSKWGLPLSLLLSLSSNLDPSKDTFYMIAASEAGEAAIQTPEFTKTRQLINKWLDEQIKPDEQEKQQ